MSNSGVLSGAGDALEGKVALARIAPFAAGIHAFFHRINRPEKRRFDPNASGGSKELIASGQNARANHQRLKENLFLKVGGKIARSSKPREARNIAGKSTAQVAEIGHWRESKECLVGHDRTAVNAFAQGSAQLRP